MTNQERLETRVNNLEFELAVERNRNRNERMRNKRHREVLEFYADAINYVAKDVKTGLAVIQKDGGEKARQELEGTQ